MDSERNYAALDETKIHGKNLEYKASENAELSEANTVVFDDVSIKEDNARKICETSNEKELYKEDTANENLNKKDSNHLVDSNGLLMKSNDNTRKKFQNRDTTSGRSRNSQKEIKNEKFCKINLKDLNRAGRKEVSPQGNVIKGINDVKDKIPSKKRNKVHFQLKQKIPNEMKNNSFKNPSKETSSPDFTTLDSEASSFGKTAHQTAFSIASGDMQSQYLLDYGFESLKEEMKALIQQCVEKEETIESLKNHLKEKEQNHSDLKKKCLHLEQKNELLSKNLDEISKKHDQAEQDLSAANSWISELKQMKKMANNTIVDLEKRLGQTLAQKEKLKSKMDVMSLGGKNAQISSQKQIEELTETNKLLSRQKSELREVVTKQMQLTNNLKRQILHLKAGIAQKYTEQEVMKVIDEFY